MSKKSITTGQFHQLLEIDAKSGIGEEVQELIRRLTSGGVAGKSDDVREAQAKRLWELGIGKELKFENFAEYLDGTVGCANGIPDIPEHLLADNAEFPLLVLVDPRVGIKRLCEIAGIEFGGDNESFVAYDARHAEFSKPTWIRIQDGRKNRNRAVCDCRKTFGAHELGLTALQGVCAFLHHPSVVSEATQEGSHVMDLSGSVRRENRGGAACLGLWKGRPKLSWYWDDGAVPKCGSASRGEC